MSAAEDQLGGLVVESFAEPAYLAGLDSILASLGRVLESQRAVGDIVVGELD